MSQCLTCIGEGIIGSGDQPHLKIGRLVTCPDCNGTGQVADVAPVQEEEIVQDTNIGDPVVTEQPTDGSVDAQPQENVDPVNNTPVEDVTPEPEVTQVQDVPTPEVVDAPPVEESVDNPQV